MNMFAGYGELREKPSDYCPDESVSMDWIEERALYCIENFQHVDTVYMSNDVYGEFVKLMLSREQLFTPNSQQPTQVSQIYTSVGLLPINRVPLLVNFCHVGSESSFHQSEWIKISQEFEEIVLGERIETTSDR